MVVQRPAGPTPPPPATPRAPLSTNPPRSSFTVSHAACSKHWCHWSRGQGWTGPELGPAGRPGTQPLRPAPVTLKSGSDDVTPQPCCLPQNPEPPTKKGACEADKAQTPCLRQEKADREWPWREDWVPSLRGHREPRTQKSCFTATSLSRGGNTPFVGLPCDQTEVN